MLLWKIVAMVILHQFLNSGHSFISPNVAKQESYLRVIIYKYQNFPIEAGKDMSQNCLKLCVFLSYVK